MFVWPLFLDFWPFNRMILVKQIDSSKIYRLKGLKPKNKGHMNFFECCDLTKKVYLVEASQVTWRRPIFANRQENFYETRKKIVHLNRFNYEVVIYYAYYTSRRFLNAIHSKKNSKKKIWRSFQRMEYQKSNLHINHKRSTTSD